VPFKTSETRAGKSRLSFIPFAFASTGDGAIPEANGTISRTDQPGRSDHEELGGIHLQVLGR
jgi:hypothetical protein